LGHHYEEATEGWERGREVEPDTAGWYLAWLYASRAPHGSQAPPMPVLQDLIKMEATAPNKAIYIGELAYAYALQGADALAQSYLQKLSQYPDSVDPYQMSLIYVALGDKDRAFELLARARDERSGGIPDLKVDPRLDSLRSDPRFSELLRSVHLSP
jgi:hypothetical protein